jgi:predicted amidohydrolase
MKAAIAQIKPVLGDLSHNIDLHFKYIQQALEQKSKLIIFPELSLTGYSLKDLTDEVAIGLKDSKLLPLIELSKKIDIVLGLVEESDEFLFYNSAIYISNGAILHVHRKLYLPTYGMFEEGRHFARANSLSSFNSQFGKGGILICEDVWHSICPLILTLQGSLFIINTANGTARGLGQQGQIGSARVWERMNSFYATNHSLYFIFCNRVGVEDGVSFWGGSEVVDPFGTIVAKASYFDEQLISADLDFSVVRRSRIKSPLLRDERLDFCLNEFQKLIKGPERDI